jgi:hypothetical protein
MITQTVSFPPTVIEKSHTEARGRGETAGKLRVIGQIETARGPVLKVPIDHVWLYPEQVQQLEAAAAQHPGVSDPNVLIAIWAQTGIEERLKAIAETAAASAVIAGGTRT